MPRLLQSPARIDDFYQVVDKLSYYEALPFCIATQRAPTYTFKLRAGFLDFVVQRLEKYMDRDEETSEEFKCYKDTNRLALITIQFLEDLLATEFAAHFQKGADVTEYVDCAMRITTKLTEHNYIPIPQDGWRKPLKELQQMELDMLDCVAWTIPRFTPYDILDLLLCEVKDPLPMMGTLAKSRLFFLVRTAAYAQCRKRALAAFVAFEWTVRELLLDHKSIYFVPDTYSERPALRKAVAKQAKTASPIVA